MRTTNILLIASSIICLINGQAIKSADDNMNAFIEHVNISIVAAEHIAENARYTMLHNFDSYYASNMLEIEALQKTINDNIEHEECTNNASEVLKELVQLMNKLMDICEVNAYLEIEQLFENVKGILLVAQESFEYCKELADDYESCMNNILNDKNVELTINMSDVVIRPGKLIENETNCLVTKYGNNVVYQCTEAINKLNECVQGEK